MHRPEGETDHSELYKEEGASNKTMVIGFVAIGLMFLVGIFYISMILPPNQSGGMATNVRETRGTEKQNADVLIGSHNAEDYIEAEEILNKPDEYLWRIVHVRGEVRGVVSSRVLLIGPVENQQDSTLIPIVNLASPIFERVIDPGFIVIAKGRIEPLNIAEIEAQHFLDFQEEAKTLSKYEGKAAIITTWTSSISH